MCSLWKKMLPLTIMVLFTVPSVYGFVVKGVEHQPVTLPCTYKVSSPGDITTMCWGRDSCPNSKCNDPLIWTDGHKVTWRKSASYDLRGNLANGDVSLTIQKASMQDQGTYCCRVEHHGWFNDMKLNMQLKVDKVRTTVRPKTTSFTTTTTKPPPVRTTTTDPTTFHIDIQTDSTEYVNTVHIATSDAVSAVMFPTENAPDAASTSFTSFVQTDPTALIDNQETNNSYSSEHTTSYTRLETDWETTSFSDDLPVEITEMGSDIPSYVSTVQYSTVTLLTANDMDPDNLPENVASVGTTSSDSSSVPSISPDMIEKQKGNSAFTDLHPKNITIKDRETSGRLPQYILPTTLSIFIIVLFLVAILVIKHRGKDSGAYQFHYNPNLELVTHAENPMSEIQDDAIETNQADKQNGL
ncbi:T-cell immunoglobulin and mucin domain-containing protein 4 isoform X1 [Bombina bombina]|uniref:T-cell immunoglobulin and mucin domain-containing protein 4 isoform X1 n=1 Tax=Bombina bombina TaxID=8345 RepID=UPI00235A4E1C|nr:T-cell immunoglobulin and mucin domain-containing protein 4 isoform X1 [Bombina bombina]XP_053574697.1 T-cell immunoglobulin and mucin domain-containing protein 4 isoform X1 [Bombina bombina]XP_053574698.1 T-cell immunoglobulin and mucin domain-containing protein 4 isoform X1 [Bombina bombina]